MSRLMSVAFTEDAVRNRTKTVTRRKGWLFLKPGDRLTLCRKVMGREKDEPLVRIAEVEVASVRREPLYLCEVDWPHEGPREGFHDITAREFMDSYFLVAQGIHADDLITRIEWRYLAEVSDD